MSKGGGNSGRADGCDRLKPTRFRLTVGKEVIPLEGEETAINNLCANEV